MDDEYECAFLCKLGIVWISLCIYVFFFPFLFSFGGKNYCNCIVCHALTWISVKLMSVEFDVPSQAMIGQEPKYKLLLNEQCNQNP